MKQKYCSKCRKLLPLSDYYMVNKDYGTRDSICKLCKLAQQKEYREMVKDTDHYKQKERERSARYYAGMSKEQRDRKNEARRLRRRRAKQASVRTCRDCWLYPCWPGLDNLSSNLALTCRSFRTKQK